MLSYKIVGYVGLNCIVFFKEAYAKPFIIILLFSCDLPLSYLQAWGGHSHT